MEACDYCGKEFDDEDALLSHLADEHQGELGPIDERRVSSHVGGGGTDLPTGPLVLGGVLVGAVLLVAFVVLGMGGGGGETINGIEVSQTPGALQSAHEHGTINVTVEGQQVDFSQSQYQYGQGEYTSDKFHFEGGVGDVWHTHAEGVTLEYAMATLGMEVERNGIVWQDETYTDSGDTEVIVEVNGESVDPSSYVLDGVASASGQGGDHVRIVVRSAD